MCGFHIMQSIQDASSTGSVLAGRYAQSKEFRARARHRLGADTSTALSSQKGKGKLTVWPLRLKEENAGNVFLEL